MTSLVRIQNAAAEPSRIARTAVDCSRLASLQFVADAIDCPNDLLIRNVFSNFSTQVLDMAIHCTITDHASVLIDTIHQLITGKYAAGVSEQYPEQAKLYRGEIQSTTVDVRPGGVRGQLRCPGTPHPGHSERPHAA